LGGVFIGLASLQFGLVVVLGKLVSNSHLPIASFLAVRFGFAAVLLALMLMVSRQPLRAAPGEGWRLAVLGMVGYAMESGLFFAALKHGTAPAVTLLFLHLPGDGYDRRHRQGPGSAGWPRGRVAGRRGGRRHTGGRGGGWCGPSTPPGPCWRSARP